MLLTSRRHPPAHADSGPDAGSPAGQADLPALIAALAGDDDRAWDAFLAHAGGFMRHVAQQALDDPALADDAVQEALLALRDVMRDRPPTFINAAAAGGWLRVLTENRARNLARGESARRRRHQRASADRGAAIVDDRGPDADAAIIARLRQALTALPDGQREALLLRFRDDLGNGDIATRLGCSVDQVAVHIHRGLHRLRQRRAPTASALALFALMREASADATTPVPSPHAATGTASSLPPLPGVIALIAAAAATLVIASWMMRSSPGDAPMRTDGTPAPLEAAPPSIAIGDGTGSRAGATPIPSDPFTAPYRRVYARGGSAFDGIRLEAAGALREIPIGMIHPVSGAVERSGEGWLLRTRGRQPGVCELAVPEIEARLAGGEPVQITLTAIIHPGADGSAAIRVGPLLAADLLEAHAPHLAQRVDIARLSNPLVWTITAIPVGRSADGHPIVELKSGSDGTYTRWLGIFAPLRLYAHTGKAHLMMRTIAWRPLRGAAEF